MRDRTYDEQPCEDCADGDHESCRRNGGFPHQDSGWDERCSCHLTGHRAILPGTT